MTTESWSVFNGRSHNLIQRSAKKGRSWRTSTEVAGPCWAPTGLWPLPATIIHPETTKRPHAPRPAAVCQETVMNLFSRQPCYLGPRFQVRVCTQWDLKSNHLLHSPTPLLDSQPSPFTKHQFLGTLSLRRYLPFGTEGVCSTGCVFCVLRVRLTICPFGRFLCV